VLLEILYICFGTGIPISLAKRKYFLSRSFKSLKIHLCIIISSLAASNLNCLRSFHSLCYWFVPKFNLIINWFHVNFEFSVTNILCLPSFVIILISGLYCIFAVRMKLFEVKCFNRRRFEQGPYTVTTSGWISRSTYSTRGCYGVRTLFKTSAVEAFCFKKFHVESWKGFCISRAVQYYDLVWLEFMGIKHAKLQIIIRLLVLCMYVRTFACMCVYVCIYIYIYGCECVRACAACPKD
jgi:hypothetical protein